MIIGRIKIQIQIDCTRSRYLSYFYSKYKKKSAHFRMSIIAATRIRGGERRGREQKAD